MRGWGSPLAPTELVTDTLTSPDWGWGDPTPTSWDIDTADYGYGSDHGLDVPPFIRPGSQRVGDDGGYLIEIEGVWPRLGASARQRPTGFSVSLVSGSSVFPCYSGRAGQVEVCSTDLRALVLSAYTPSLPVGDYDVRVTWNSETIDAGSISVERRLYSDEEFFLKGALPSPMDVGARALQHVALLAGDPREERHSVLGVLIRSIGHALADHSARVGVTRLTADLAPSDATLYLESTLGFGEQGAVWIGSTLITYTTRTETTLTGLARPLGQPATHPKKAQVTHDPHYLTN